MDRAGTLQCPTPEGTRPIRQLPHRLRPHKEQETKCQVQDLLARGIIEPTNGAWSSPVVLVHKNDQSWLFCIDYRKLSAVTLLDTYPLPRTNGYRQVLLIADAQEKRAFTTHSGLWKRKVLQFGLTSAPASFQS